MSPINPISEVRTSFDLVEWADSEHEASLEPNALKEPEEDPNGVPISMRFSSDWEAVTTPGATFLGVPRVILEGVVGVWVTRGTYYGSHLSLDEPINCQNSATDLHRPLE